MDRSSVISLITESYNKDSYGVNRKTESLRKIYANVASVTLQEFFQAGQAGLKPECRFTVFAYDYHGESKVEHNGIRYSVYRVYRGRNDMMELYCQRDVVDDKR